MAKVRQKRPSLRSDAAGRRPGPAPAAVPVAAPDWSLASFDWRRDAPIVLALIAVTIAVYAPAAHYGLITLDDPVYVANNPHVTGGFSMRDVVWAFTTVHASYWIPLTWLSLMLDATMFAGRIGGYHTTNFVLHAVNAALLYLVLARATGRRGPSAIVAAIFALHPLHVESVAWVTERKDVLSTACWWLAILAYLRYVQRPGWRRYALVVLALIAGLLAKPMLVSLPVTLLLLDVWPLQRVRRVIAGATSTPARQTLWQRWWPLVREKVPLFVICAAATALTIVTQHSTGAMSGLADLPIGPRVSGAIVSSVWYLWKAIVPTGLAVLYPLTQTTPMAEIVAAAGVLVVISAIVWRFAATRPYLAVGWMWYLVTLLPVSGVLQAGPQATADRFTYVPLVGVLIAVVWLIDDEVRAPRRARVVALAACAAVVVACAVTSRAQLQYWRDGEAAWRHAIAVTGDNYVAEDGLGSVLIEQGHMAEGIAHVQRALAINPSFARAHHNLAVAFARTGQLTSAATEDARAAALAPVQQDASEYNALGEELVAQGDVDRGVSEYETAIRLKPDYASAHANLGLAYLKLGHVDEAIDQLTDAVQEDPAAGTAHAGLGKALAAKDDFALAEAQELQAITLDPSLTDTRVDLGFAYLGEGKDQRALDAFRQAIGAEPASSDAHMGAGLAMSALGDRADAVKELREAVRLDPANQDAAKALEAIVHQE